MTVFRRETCRLCGSGGLKVVLQLAPTALGDHFVPAEKRRTQPAYPLDMALCAVCGNAQLMDVVKPDVIYEDYVYTTSVSLGLPRHFQEYADWVVGLLGLPQGALVVEMGSNEGALLRAFKQHGMKVLGIDPAKAIAAAAGESGIPTLPDYFTAGLAGKIRDEHGAASVVSANNVFANIDDLDDVMEGVRTLLAPDGVFVIETSYLADVLDKALIDTIFHEHLTYFSVIPLDIFFKKHGMEVIEVKRVPTKGGSIRVVAQLLGGPRSVGGSVDEVKAIERQSGVQSAAAFAALSAELEKVKSELATLLKSIKAEGKTVAAYGAAVGLTTMIYHFGLNDWIDFIVDDNQSKQNMFSPGFHIPVLPSEALYERKPDFALILAWRYADTIMKRHQRFSDQGGRFILPLPAVEVVEG